MSGNIGVKLDRMNALLTQILERLPELESGIPLGVRAQAEYDDKLGEALTERHKIPEEVLQFPKRRGWPKGKPRKVSG